MYIGDEVPFDVIDEIEVADLTDVKEERQLIPPVKDLKVRITKGKKSPQILSNANPKEHKEADIKGLGLQLNIVDGIPVENKETGVTEMKYIGKPLFTGLMDLLYWANLDIAGKKGKRSDSDWWKKNQHLVGLKKFCTALDIPLKGLKVNDAFLTDLIGREVLIDVQHAKEQVLDPSTGEYVDTGGFKEKITNWKKVA